MAQQVVVPNSDGAILTIGLLVNGERCANVEPYGLAGGGVGPVLLASDLCNSWLAGQLSNYLAMISSDAQITFLAAEGMQDGVVPQRLDFAPGTHVGTNAAGASPTQVAALIIYYEDPADVVPGHRIRVAKTFVVGVPDGNIDGNAINSAQEGHLDNYGQQAQLGFASVLNPSSTWQRMLSVPKPRATPANIPRIVTFGARGGIYTQKRRLVPRN